MSYTNDIQYYVDRLKGRKFFINRHLNQHIRKEDVVEITQESTIQYNSNYGYIIHKPKIYKPKSDNFVLPGFISLSDLMYCCIPIYEDDIEIPTSVNTIKVNNKYDKYKGAIVLEIKNNKIILSSNLLAMLNVEDKDKVVFSTTDNNKLFITKSLEEEGITPVRNRIYGNEAKNIIEFIRTVYGKENMFSVKPVIVKDSDEPDYCYYEIFPKIDKNNDIASKKKDINKEIDKLVVS